jgi:hypothetical protein
MSFEGDAGAIVDAATAFFGAAAELPEKKEAIDLCM